MARIRDQAEPHATCPQCGHHFAMRDQGEAVAQAVAPVEATLPKHRADDLARIRQIVKASFPKCRVTTNDDHNLSTPYIVTVHFPNGRSRAARADSVRVDVDLFAKRAIEQIGRWSNTVFGGEALHSA